MWWWYSEPKVAPLPPFPRVEFNLGLLSEILDKRAPITTGHTPVRLGSELRDGGIVEPTPFEPDPLTHRSDYYYNSDKNILFRRIVSKTRTGIPIASWKPINTI